MPSRVSAAGVASMTAALTLCGCHSSHHESKQPSPAASPFSLYTHCGINETRIGNLYYVAETPLSDGEGNPPAGWDNPYQQGTITVSSPSTAIFRDSRHHEVTFRLRPGASTFLQVCS